MKNSKNKKPNNELNKIDNFKFQIDGKDQQVKIEKDLERFFFCECHGEGMLVTKFAGENQFYFSYWGQGFHPKAQSFWDRIRGCWKIITTGNAYDDELVLSAETAKKMAHFLISNI